MSVSKVTGASNGTNAVQADLRAAAKAKVSFAEVLKGESKRGDEPSLEALKLRENSLEGESVKSQDLPETQTSSEREVKEALPEEVDEEVEVLEDDIAQEENEVAGAELARGLVLQTEPTQVQTAQAQPTAGPQARHEVVERLIETMVSDGKLGEDASGRKVLMMDIQCPGRGNVRVRLWKKEEGIELRIRADNPELKSLIMMGRSELQSSAKERGVVFSKIEVA